MGEYTPETGEVRAHYVSGRALILMTTDPSPFYEFERWLAALKREWQAEALEALNELFLNMRDRVAGYVSAPPLHHQFQRGATAFEWAATNVRRAFDGEPFLNPPVPIRPLTDEDSPKDGWKHYVLTCEECGHRFVCEAKVAIEHTVYEDTAEFVYHYGRIIPAGSPLSEGDTTK